MSDSEPEVIDGSSMQDIEEDDVAVQRIGGLQRFDPVTGKPIVDDSQADDIDMDGDAAPQQSATAAYMSSMPALPTISHAETHHLTLAQKNASNTGDLTKPHMLGIDEAGRGPVLGSMVYGICWCPIEKLDELKNIRVADSKTLTFAQRQGLFANIQNCPWLGYEVDVISAERLSREMLRRQKVNLNAISHDSAIMLIQKVIDHGVNVREIYVDTVGDAGQSMA
jgi:ribonuclease HIII